MAAKVEELKLGLVQTDETDTYLLIWDAMKKDTKIAEDQLKSTDILNADQIF